ncbi:ribokinase [Paraburkholderia nemoris]|uniref:ribokinase n=1 Tax=Paraburkholderia nemoris TaxID=2793076 RepID=UPI0038BAD771
MSESVAVLGSLHIDLLVSAARLPTLGETLIGSDWYQTPGGKGLNQAVACALAGADVAMLGAVGSDAFGDALLSYLEDQKIGANGVVRVPGARSGMSIVVRTPDDYAAVVSSQVNASLTKEMLQAWSDTLSSTQILVLQNEIPEAVNAAAAALVRERGGRVVLNAAPARAFSESMLAQTSILVVNAVEAAMMGADPVLDLESAWGGCRRLGEQFGCAVVVTAGPHGAAWMDHAGDYGTVAGESVEVISSHGAGDTFIGHLVAQLANGASLCHAVAVANRQAAVFVSTPRMTADAE